jgi:hypothetical protein
MVSAGIVFDNCVDCTVSGGSIKGYEAGVLATNTRGLKVNGMQLETVIGIEAENCSNLNFNNNKHKQLIRTKPVANLEQASVWPVKRGINIPRYSPGLSVTMFYALNYLKCFGYNPYS